MQSAPRRAIDTTAAPLLRQEILFGGEKGAPNAPPGVGPMRLEVAKSMEHNEVPSETIFNQTGWYRGPDEHWKWVLPDKDARLNQDHFVTYNPGTEKEFSLFKSSDPNTTYKLPDLLHHPDLYATYPELKDITVKHLPVKDQASGVVAGFNSPSNTMFLSDLRSHKDMVSSLLHELQHAIQKQENFARGGNLEEFYRQQGTGLTPDQAYDVAFDKYRRLAGETEARQVQEQYRQQFWDRRPTDLEGFPPADQQIIKWIPPSSLGAREAGPVSAPDQQSVTIPTYKTISVDYDPWQMQTEPVDHNPWEGQPDPWAYKPVVDEFDEPKSIKDVFERLAVTPKDNRDVHLLAPGQVKSSIRQYGLPTGQPMGDQIGGIFAQPKPPPAGDVVLPPSTNTYFNPSGGQIYRNYDFDKSVDQKQIGYAEPYRLTPQQALPINPDDFSQRLPLIGNVPSQTPVQPMFENLPWMQGEPPQSYVGRSTGGAFEPGTPGPYGVWGPYPGPPGITGEYSGHGKISNYFGRRSPLRGTYRHVIPF